MSPKSYNIIIDHGVSAPRHGGEVVYGINTTEKSSLFQLMETMKPPGSKGYCTQISTHYATHKVYVSLAWEFKKHLYNASRKNGVVDQGK